MDTDILVQKIKVTEPLYPLPDMDGKTTVKNTTLVIKSLLLYTYVDEE
jgi:hypothetical protein